VSPGAEPARVSPGAEPARVSPGAEPAHALPGSEPARASPGAGTSGASPQAAGERRARPPVDRVLTSEDFDGVSWEIVSPGVTELPPVVAERSRAAVRPAGGRTPLAPPAWVLPEEPEEAVEDPLAGLGVSEAWAAPPESFPAEAGLSAAGAFDDRKERRMGLRAFDPGRRGVRALVAIAVLVVVVAAFLAWRARPRVDPVAAPSFEAGAVSDAVTPAPSVSAAGVIVAVEGKVRKPGLVHLPAGARVADALEAVGGANPGVDVAMLNLARKVVDGELILVGVTPSPGVAVPTAPAGAGAAGAAGGPVNLNTATLADLDTLPGVGPVLAQRILDARTAQGGFKAVSDLRKVDGIGDARFEQLKDLVTV
jgi:competence protein ComEA